MTGVRLNEPGTLKFRFVASGLKGEPWSLSKTGTVPLWLKHG
jgi:hypothetical protein